MLPFIEKIKESKPVEKIKDLAKKKDVSALVPCEPSLVYEILVDYDNYFEWLPFLSQSKLLAKEGDLAISEFEVMSPKPVKCALECIHTKNKAVLARKISGEVSLQQIEWKLTAAANNQTYVSVKVDREPTWKKPWKRHRKIFSPEAYLEALSSRISIYSPDFAISDKTGRKIVELSATDDGLTLWVMGKKYQLKPSGEDNHG